MPKKKGIPHIRRFNKENYFHVDDFPTKKEAREWVKTIDKHTRYRIVKTHGRYAFYVSSKAR